MIMCDNKNDRPTFLSHIYEEKIEHKKHRNEFVKQKLMFIIGLFSIGSLNASSQVDLTKLFYLIPFVALAYDVYIFSEDFKVKRIGVFIRRQKKLDESLDCAWENWLKNGEKNREHMALYASLALTVLTMISSSYLIHSHKPDMFFYVWWFAIATVCGITVFGYGFVQLYQMYRNN